MSMVSLSGAELEALPLGSTVHDCDGDELTRVEDGWKYSYFKHRVLTSGEVAAFYSPVTLEWRIQGTHLWDFANIYYNAMTEEEQNAITAIVDKVIHRDQREGTTDVE